MNQNRSSAVMQQRIEPQIISRSDALKLGSLRYFTGEPCVRGHLSERLVANWTRLACSAEAHKVDRRDNPERAKDRDRKKYWKDPDKSRANGRAQREKHGAKRLAYDKARYQKPERQAAQKRQAVLWGKLNKGKRASIIAARRAIQKLATPPWLTDEQRLQIREFYLEAARREGEWHVDHIVPVKGENVCGLHVPWNLQLLTGDENRRKRNTHAE